MTTWRKRIIRIVGMMFVVVFFVVVYGGYSFFNPYDEVTIDIYGIPKNTNFVCLIADTENGTRAMEWSLSKVIPHSMHPDGCGASRLTGANKTKTHRAVRWISSDRVGILCRADQKWIAFWFDSPKCQPANRSYLFGGGSITIDISDADNNAPMDDNQLRDIGMNDELKNDGITNGLKLGDRSTGEVPPSSTDSFRMVVSDLIEARRYRDAVVYLKNGDAQLQANYDKTGFLAVGEDLIVLPGVYPEHDYVRDRDWFIPGTSDAIEDEAWQNIATEFAKRYNQHRVSK